MSRTSKTASEAWMSAASTILWIMPTGTNTQRTNTPMWMLFFSFHFFENEKVNKVGLSMFQYSCGYRVPTQTLVIKGKEINSTPKPLPLWSCFFFFFTPRSPWFSLSLLRLCCAAGVAPGSARVVNRSQGATAGSRFSEADLFPSELLAEGFACFAFFGRSVLFQWCFVGKLASFAAEDLAAFFRMVCLVGKLRLVVLGLKVGSNGGFAWSFRTYYGSEMLVTFAKTPNIFWNWSWCGTPAS